MSYSMTKLRGAHKACILYKLLYYIVVNNLVKLTYIESIRVEFNVEWIFVSFLYKLGKSKSFQGRVL